MKKIIIFSAIGVVAVAIVCFFFFKQPANTGNTDSYGYKEVALPDFATTPDDGKNSWEHDNEKFEFDWYVNTSSFSWQFGNDTVSRIIEEKTGAKINFITPVTDDGSKLSTMIAGNKLPDVISIESWSQTTNQLAAQGYTYPLDDLIEKWAPSFKKIIQQDVWNWFKQANGKTYGIPNFAYSNQYIKADDKMEPNGGILVREDWFKEVQAAGIDMTNPNGFIEGCKYIKNKYNRSIPIQLDNFDLEGNASINWLAQYFACSYEDENGEYIYRVTHENYVEMLMFLNNCYTNGLISDGNFSANNENIKSSLASGNVFVSMVTPQDFQQSFVNCFNKGVTYVPLVLRNSKGEDPVLQDIRGMGYLFTMVTTNAKRPDKIIKVLEYLYSEEGQRLVAFGEEGVTWRFTDETKTEVEWTEQYLEDFANDRTGKYGLYQMTLLMNLAYINKIKPQNGKRPVDIYIENLKRPLSPYSYDYTANFLKHDTADKDYFKTSTTATRLTQKWAEFLPDIIRSKNNEQAKATYDKSIDYLVRNGLNDVIAFYKKSYNNAKNIMGVEIAWPPYMEGYENVTTGPNGDFSYWKGATHD